MLYVHIFDMHSVIYSLNQYKLDKLVMLTCQLHAFQDLIGLEGDDLVNFMASTGNKYDIDNLSLIFSIFFLVFVRSLRYHYVVKWSN